MYAYSEYLNKIGIPSDYYIVGNPKKEVQIVCNLFNINLYGSKEIFEEQQVVLLDTNNLEEAPFLKPEQIVEIIDHHSKNKSSEQCKNAKIHIERLGAVATLIAEKFRNDNVRISRESAILLYYGIISNSINLKASITNQKDIDMAGWLEEQCDEITKEKIEELSNKYNCKNNIIECVEPFLSKTDLIEKVKTVNFITEASFIDSKNKMILGPGPVTAHEVNEYITQESYEKTVEQYIEIINKVCK